MDPTSLHNRSLTILSERILGYEFRALVSPIGFLAYFIIITTIICSKPLHNKPHFLIFSHAICDIGRACSIFGLGLGHYISFLHNRPVSHSYLFCMLMQLSLVLTARCNVYFTAALGIDRFIGIAFPAWYYKLSTRKYIFTVNAVSYLLGAFFTFLYDVSAGNFEEMAPICEDLIYIPAETRLWQQTLSIGELALITAIYILSTLFLWRRYRNANPIGETQRSEWRQQVDFKAFLVISAMGIIFLLTTLAPQVFYASVSLVPSFRTPNGTSMIGSFFNVLRSLSNLTINLTINSIFRVQFLRLFCRRNPNSVTHLGS